MDSLYLVMPAYNEEANIQNTVEAWYPILKGKAPESRLVVADSGSSDATHEILLELQKKYPKLEILTESERQHGPKVIALYDLAIKNNIDYVFQTDSDGQTDPAEFDAFWKLRKKHDSIIGYRPVRGDGQSRAMVEKVVCLLVRLFFGVKVPDANAPFRLMKVDVVKKYLYRMQPDYALPNIMMTTWLMYYKEDTAFRHISFKPRQGGKNSINLRRIVKIGWRALQDFWKFRQDM